MLYINANTTTVLIPRVSTDIVTGIKFRHQTSHKETSLTVSDTTPTKDYYTFNISSIAATLDEGQYDYSVTTATGVAATGVAQVGEYTADVAQHSTTINIKEYNG